jgi:SAM-dependent methyltransferase
MTSVKEHYDRHLGPVYGWMLGDFAEAVDAARAELAQAGVPADARGIAIDLGAGTGVHAVALADMGYPVTAIDSCAPLLDELRNNSGARDIRAVPGDITSFAQLGPVPAGAIVCMGDTLTHLESLEAVEQLFRDVSSALAPGGVFVSTFRDYATSELRGTERFIPVRSDADRILTCFLDYREDTVLVHDILQERSDEGWNTSVSAYPKLRIDPLWALTVLSDSGLSATMAQGSRGMMRVVGRCPTSVSS